MAAALATVADFFGTVRVEPRFRRVAVAGGMLLLLAAAGWGIVGTRAAADTKVAPLYVAAAQPIQMVNVPDYTVAQVVKKLPMALRFELLLQRTGVMQQLSGPGPYTILAPADNYFDYLPNGGLPAMTRQDE